MSDERLTTRQWQARVLATRERLMRERKRIWPDGTTRRCPICEKHTLLGRSDLTRELDADGAVLVFANLHGARCSTCETEFLEGYEQVALEERAGTSFRTAVSGSVTLLGGNHLGTYWPKDVVRAVQMHPKDALEITPLADDTFVVRVVHTDHRKDAPKAVTQAKQPAAKRAAPKPGAKRAPPRKGPSKQDR